MSAAFCGTDRFVLLEPLGEGGMGVVYRAVDRDSGTVVALKTLARAGANAIVQLKKEFRTLADLSHPNVVQLYELICDAEHWFFTMELVDGGPFTDFVRPDPERRAGSRTRSGVRCAPAHSPTAATIDAPSPAVLESLKARRSDPTMRPLLPLDTPRLRAALRLLADGLLAIHGAGKLHRDIKPSNVLVTPEGRVVVLDFGIAADYEPGHAQTEDRLHGTPEYMAPEQAAFRASSPASDWYAVGVMLYEALTDRLPYEGSAMSILIAKQKAPPPRPRSVAPNVPEDLDELCMDLLQCRPEDRPAGPAIRRRLASPDAPTPAGGQQATARTGPRTGEAPFVGRTAELSVLHEALEASLLGEMHTVCVSGRSGMGKSALVERFVGEARAAGVLVLSGRCYERESVPYKAFDSLVDAISRHLSSLPSTEVLELLPDTMHELALVFPVLRTVPAVEATRPAGPHELDPHELRRRAFLALKQVLAALARTRPVCAHIDDLQWGDADSAGLLEELAAPPDAPRVLLLLVYRSEHEGSSPMLDAMRRLRQGRGPSRTLEIGELSEDEALEVARALLPAALGGQGDRALSIAREAGGNPFFLAELVRYEEERAARRRGRDSAAPSQRAVSLEEVLLVRIARLPEELRRIMHVLSIAGGPLAQNVVLRVAGLDSGSPAPITTLRAAKLVRTHGSGDRSVVEAFHDRIRETVAKHLEGDPRRELHRRLALTLATTDADPETLLQHFLAAGDAAQAESYALAAASAALHGLAFRRAARLFAAAIELHGGPAPYELLRQHADALAYAGLGGEAGRAYLTASARTSGGAAVESLRLAAEQLLKSGHEHEGIEVLVRVLSAVGLVYPSSPTRALASLLYHRARLELVRERFRERRAADVPRAELARVDVAFTATVGLSLTDAIRGAAFGAQHLALALRAGEPFRICRSLALEAATAAATGQSGQRRSERLAGAARALAARIDDPHVVGLAKVATSSTPFFLGHWRSARRELDQAEGMLRERGRGVAWEIASAQFWSCNALILCGELNELRRRVPRILKEARERGDLFALTHMIYPATVACLVEDDLERARRAATDDAPAWSADRYTGGHWGAMISTISVDRYEGRAIDAHRRVDRDWPALERSHLLRVQVIRVFSLFERALSSVAAQGAHRDGKALLREAERDAQRILREGTAYSAGMGHLVLACASAARGQRAGSIAELDRAIEGLDRADLGYLAACARRRKGEIVPGEDGRAAAVRASEFFQGQGVVCPARCAAMSAPGFSRVGA